MMNIFLLALSAYSLFTYWYLRGMVLTALDRSFEQDFHQRIFFFVLWLLSPFTFAFGGAAFAFWANQWKD